jgi:prepilin-type N-terminal cleavage/methylation domain-containing protein
MSRFRARSQDGFTLIEVMVAISVLLIGVLGTVTMVDGASKATSRTKAREGGTALARTVLEVARGVPFENLTSERVVDEIALRSGLADSDAVTPGHQITSRGFTYTVLPTVCSMDDPKDALGEHDLPVPFCSDSDVMAGGGGAIDRNPDDYRRVVVQLTWAGGPDTTDSVRQTGIVTNPVGGLGPSVIDFDPDVPGTAEITGGTSASYDVRTSTDAAQVTWAVNGRRLGDADGSERDWSFDWPLGDVDDPLFLDCTYVLQAEAFDDNGRSGAAKALTITLNRRQPFPPPNFEGGRIVSDPGSDDVDLQWDKNRECDIQGYRVYRGVDGGPVDTVVDECTIAAGAKTECVDVDPPAGTLTYHVVALDTGLTGPRPGDPSTQVVVPMSTTNQPPATPTPLTACTGGNPGCNDFEGNPAPEGTAVLQWGASTDPDGDAIAFYRVYRGGTTYADRLDILFPVDPLVFIDSTVTGSHTYYVTAVDEHFAESAPVGPVSWP